MITSTPSFKKLLQRGKERHARFKKWGHDFRGVPDLKDRFPTSQHKSIIDAIVATCSTKEEIQGALRLSGFDCYDVEVMEEPIDEFKQAAITICIAMMGTLTKKGIPCILKLKK